ncbi:hypothetical protein [Geomonas silvestris]|uniref:hypothetical protein n=1 Tax=Geomonas silvestris TaxID=2740184 RepID=UPI001616E098|nr:hypothetical protein [Geomonas silvestris]
MAGMMHRAPTLYDFFREGKLPPRATPLRSAEFPRLAQEPADLWVVLPRFEGESDRAGTEEAIFPGAVNTFQQKLSPFGEYKQLSSKSANFLRDVNSFWAKRITIHWNGGIFSEEVATFSNKLQLSSRK